MAREQLGICAEPNLHGLVLLMNALDGHDAIIRQILGNIPSVIHRLADQFSEANLSAVVAIGANYWDNLYPHQRPHGLAPFPAININDLEIPSVPFDVMLNLRADRYDVLHLASQQCYQMMQPYLELVEQSHAFRFMDGRDLTGFLDNPQAPKGRQKRALALIAESEDSQFAGGSFLYYQRYRLDLVRWQQLTQIQQESIMGRGKLDGELLSSGQLLDESHAQIATTLDVDGQHLPLLFQNMPYGHLRGQGLLMFGYSADPACFLRWLRARLGDVDQQNYDLLLDYVQADSGAAFFAPSLNFLEEHAGL
jgi:putative iron-dependent peroxidase